MVDGIAKRHATPGNGGGARAAIGLDHVAVDFDGVLAELVQIDHGAQDPADEPLDFLRTTALLAVRRLAIHARTGGTRQHAIFGSNPSLARSLQETRHAGIDTRRANNFGIAKLHQHRAFGMLGKITGQPYIAQLICCPATGSYYIHYVYCLWLKARTMHASEGHSRKLAFPAIQLRRRTRTLIYHM